MARGHLHPKSLSDIAILLRRTMHRHLLCSRPEKSSTYSSEYAFGFSGLRSRICPRLLRS